MTPSLNPTNNLKESSFLSCESGDDTRSSSSYIQLKVGSLQKFVNNIGPIENFAPEIFNADEIHKIAILDLRMCNLDRNLCNILV